jgi:trk system potassium uptake protein TrkH
MWKSLLRELRLMIRPRSVEQVRMDAKPMEEDTIRGTVYFMIAHMFILAISYFLVAFDNLCPEDTVSAVISCLNNVGPGIGVVGPAGSYASLSYFSKVVLTLDMLLGRLEIFPILLSAMALTKRIRSYH